MRQRRRLREAVAASVLQPAAAVRHRARRLPNILKGTAIEFRTAGRRTRPWRWTAGARKYRRSAVQEILRGSALDFQTAGERETGAYPVGESTGR